MRYVFIVMVLIGLTACGDVTIVSEYVTPNDFKQAEEVCKSNGGLKGAFVTSPGRYNTNIYIKVECNNGVMASQVRGK